MRIHHATVAKAKKFQITLTVEDNEIVATGKTGTRLAAGPQGNKVLEDAITRQTGKVAKGVKPTADTIKAALKRVRRVNKPAPHSEEEAELDNEEADEETGTKSVVKAKYKIKYKPTKNRCGDELSHHMNEHCSREDDDGEVKINLDALRKFAKANECWVESYASFKSRTGGWNGGFAMMNTNNRLRARLRRIEKEEGRPFDINKDIVWK